MAAPSSGSDEGWTLPGGVYAGKIKKIVCKKCAPRIRKTLQKTRGIDTVSVNQLDSTVRFTVSPDEKLEFSELQDKLDRAARKMGKGADYGIIDLENVAFAGPKPAGGCGCGMDRCAGTAGGRCGCCGGRNEKAR